MKLPPISRNLGNQSIWITVCVGWVVKPIWQCQDYESAWSSYPSLTRRRGLKILPWSWSMMLGITRRRGLGLWWCQVSCSSALMTDLGYKPCETQIRWIVCHCQVELFFAVIRMDWSIKSIFSPHRLLHIGRLKYNATFTQLGRESLRFSKKKVWNFSDGSFAHLIQVWGNHIRTSKYSLIRPWNWTWKMSN